jgi:hypothetical protein
MDGPFERSQMPVTPVEGFVAGMIWRHQGRDNPVPIKEIVRVAAISFRLPNLSDRKVKEIVQQLRVVHRCPIGARREEPAGYFWIVDAEDLEAGLGPYRAQVIEGWRVLRAIAPRAWVLQLHGQLTLDEVDAI